VTSRW